MKKQLVTFAIIFLLINIHPISAQTYQKERTDTLDKLFVPFFENVIGSDGSVPRDLADQGSLRTGLTSGLSIVTLMQLYDLYGVNEFLTQAQSISDFIATGLQDPRYPLFSTYYDLDSGIQSNYRSVIDNFLIAWGLDMLAKRIDPSNELAVKREMDRFKFVAKDLGEFNETTGFQTRIRVDSPIQSNIFDVFTNLFAAYIITETNSSIFAELQAKPQKIFDYVYENATTPNGGVHTLVFNGISDNLVTLKNTALFANLAMNLYSQTSDLYYLNVANSTMEYIQNEFYDIGVTGGYLEALIDGAPVQQTKSLFSHALLLQLLLKLANREDNTARLNLLAIWRTISNYFRKSYYFFSSLDRGGDPASSAINTVDNLMMLYSMSSIPLLTQFNYTSQVQYRDRINLKMQVQIPKSVNSSIVIEVYDQVENGYVELQRKEMSGDVKQQMVDLYLNPIKPRGDSERFDYRVSLETEGIKTDQIKFHITVSLAPGIDLSIGVITIFSVMAIVIFVLFVKRYDSIRE